MITTFYVFNENGIIPREQLKMYCSDFQEKTKLDFTIQCKEDINLRSTIFRKYTSGDIEYLVYDHGYVMKVEGGILKAMLVLQEIDNCIDSSVCLYVSPSQRVVNEEESKFTRGASLKVIANFLDNRFFNSEYSNVLVNSEEE